MKSDQHHEQFDQHSTIIAPDLRPADYFPLSHGLYEVKPGLQPLNADFGNGLQDKRLFQIDQDFAQYRQAKLTARAENREKYYQTQEFSLAMQRELTSFMAWRLTRDYPDWFHYKQHDGNHFQLECRLTGELLLFDCDFALTQVKTNDTRPTPNYASSLDAMACQIQEDLALVSLDENGKNWLSAIHLCYPNYWGAQDKIGRDFASIHDPVAGIETINRNASNIVQAMIHKGPFVRFSWGLATDARLNHHPDAPSGEDAAEWYGRAFDPAQGNLFLRVERQTIFGFPEINSALFTIRTYVSDCREIKKDQSKNAALRSAIHSMTEASLVYKGLVDQKQEILDWLKQE